MTSIPAACAALALAACGQETAADAPALVAVADHAAECGLEMQDRLDWGQAVSGSGLEMQEVRAEPGLVLRVWSEHDAGLAQEDGVLTGAARGPAWIVGERSPNAFMVHLPEGAAALRVDAETGFTCAAA